MPVLALIFRFKPFVMGRNSLLMPTDDNSCPFHNSFMVCNVVLRVACLGMSTLGEYPVSLTPIHSVCTEPRYF